MATDDFPAYPEHAAHERQTRAAALMAEYIRASGQNTGLPLLTWTVTSGGALTGECAFREREERVRAFDAWADYLGGERDDTDLAARIVFYKGEDDLRFAVVLLARDYDAQRDAVAA
ncbi:hypothetical protein [Streptomyces sp. SP18BB07]|uniref:hypothetical protein n=1 Tax=Streptomyces sp. SP18BB07 TaxID=3002522 RepID=UPI002E783C43|nr:hypothetical protein [Streptomyces sp. SP18BB07]MEE1764345.1 hypothetical protein [Streptomyces sp. SP18BB07]